jgi:hypothetical protein
LPANGIERPERRGTARNSPDRAQQ